MADNTQLNAATTVGDVIATDDVAGVKYQRVKVSIGADGAASDVHSGNPLPVDDAGGSLTVDDGGGSLTVDGTVAISGTVAVTDNAGSLTVDGTVTANAGTGFAPVVTDGVAAGTTGLHVLGTDGTNAQIVKTDAAGELQVDVLTMPTVTVQDGGGSLTVDGTVAVSGTVTVDGSGVTQPVSGTVTVTQATASNLKATVTVIDSTGDSAMDDANNAIRVNVVAGGAGDGAILDGVSSSIKATVLDYTSSNPLAVRLTDTNGDYVTAGGGSQYADGDAVATPTGTVAMGHDGTNARAVTVDAAGDLQVDVLTMPTVTVQDGGGAISVDDNGGSLTVDGTVTVQDGGGSITVDGTVTANAGTGFAPVVTDGAAAGTTGLHVLGTDGTNAQILSTNASGHVNIADGGNSITVDGTVTANLAAGTNNIGDVDVLTVPAPLSTSGGGTEATALRVTIASDSTGVVSVDDNGGSLTVDGSVTVSGTVTASNTAGDVAHDTGDSGNPVKVGSKAATALPTAVASADRANAISDRYGRILVNHIDAGMYAWKSANYTTTQTGTAIWTPTSGNRIVITSIVIGSYGTTAARLILWFGASADTTYTAGTDQLVLAASFAPGTSSKPGLVFTPAVPVFSTTTNDVLRITTDAGMSVDIAVHGYEVTP